MENSPLFSVLIAQYNNAPYLMEAIDSVRQQTYSNWEIIIVDDCSTDNSQEIYNLISNDVRISIYYNSNNKGCGYTKSKCASLANGSYMGFLDPDDALMPNAIEETINALINNEKASVAFTRHYLCDKDMNIFDESRLLHLPKSKSYFEHADFRAEHFVVFKKDFYNKTNGMNPTYRLADDADLNFIMEEVGDIVIIDKFLYKHRKFLQTSATANYTKHLFWNILVQYDTCKRRGLDVEKHVYDFYLSSVEYAQNEMIKNAEDKVRKSKAYRLGRFILNPLSFIVKKKK
jgi:glycosyltransferase involved in cell wall biosynthesis